MSIFIPKLTELLPKTPREEMSQKEAIATIYALARTSLEMRSKEHETLERIAEIVETEFIVHSGNPKNKTVM